MSKVKYKTVNVPPNLHKKLKQLSAKIDIKIIDILPLMLRAYIKELKKGSRK